MIETLLIKLLILHKEFLTCNNTINKLFKEIIFIKKTNIRKNLG